jgi:proteasome lid subunit RPN8/RPN11
MLVLSEEDLALIGAEGQKSYPHECCGFLVGAWSGDRKQVQEIHPVENARADSLHNRYLIPPEVFLRVQKAVESRQLDVVGFYHSHPDVEAQPSAFDRDHAWPGYSYVIVSVRGGSPRETRSWVLEQDRAAFREEAVSVSGSALRTGPVPGETLQAARPEERR